MSTPGAASARAVYRSDGLVDITFTYKPEVVEGIKDLVPSHDRTYNPTTKTWVVSTGWAPIVIRFLEWHYPGKVTVDASFGGSVGPEPIRKTDADYAELHLLPTAPPELVASAYKVLAKRHHPDAGGTDGEMKRLNSAYARLREKAGAA